MAHCPPERLADLSAELAEVQTWEAVLERSTGTYTLGGNAFLHFHVKGDHRWADVKGVDGWSQLVIDEGTTAGERDDFMATLSAAHRDRVSVRG